MRREDSRVRTNSPALYDGVDGVAPQAGRMEIHRREVGIPGAIRDSVGMMRSLAVKKDLELHGQKLREGQPVLFLYPSANRDEREFENPDVLDIQRRAPRILSFGHGIHGCIGMNTAKMEARVCLEAVAEHIPDYEVDTENAERLRTEFVQGFAKLPIRFTPA